MDFTARLERVTGDVAAALAGADPAALVPSCPGWTVHDLGTHLATTHRWAASVLRTGESVAKEPVSCLPDELARTYADAAGELLGTLREVDPDRPTWNFVGITSVAAFWPRRQTHEATVHLVDLDLAEGRSTVLDPDLCADGVDEVLRVFLVRTRQRGYPTDLVADLCLEAVDTGHAWTLRPVSDGAPRVADGSCAGADTVRGTAEDLYRALWKRSQPGDLDVVGDPDRVNWFFRSVLTP